MGAGVVEHQLEGFRILGRTRAGEETLFVVPEFNVGFDLGRAPREIVDANHVFLSHGHMDHAAGVAYYFSQRMFIDNAPGNLYVPRGLEEPIQQLLKIWGDIDGHEPPANVHVATPGEDIYLNRNLLVRPFEVVHPARRRDGRVIQSLGYAVVEQRRKIYEEYSNLTGPQIVELKKQGVEISRVVEFPLVTYCGDTGPGEYLNLPHVREARVLLLECTFIEGGHLDRARAGGHMHLSDLKQILPSLENDRIFLTHLSRRTPLPLARKLVEAEFGAEYGDRLRIFMDAPRRKRHRRPPPQGGMQDHVRET